ncbi:hypothetical protein XCCB100_0827 [Xanthomonas campestris pv. campestris]|uniref:Uncharacterized protein n=1 Tax=Xanthomonas campestris pv. campestris (strain B100) TaxID=509169 RepID=B0RNY5_XANCB|nr:hypothetical protein XCCB100_0827 [Xanthomonas campestris pv. campestris]
MRRALPPLGYDGEPGICAQALKQALKTVLTARIACVWI